MKKLLILLGALSIVTTAFAGGKDTVPEPENPVRVKEIYVDKVIYKNRENGGYIDFYYEWRGKSSAHSKKGHKDYLPSNYGFLHLEGEVNLTEKQKLYFEIEDYQAWSHDKHNRWAPDDERTEITLEYTYQHDFLGGMASKLIYKSNDSSDGGEIVGNVAEYQAQWNFADYLFNNNYIKTTDFTIAPKLGYNWERNNSDSEHLHDSYFGIDLYSTYELPWNFELEFNLYFTQHSYNKRIVENKKKNFTASMELYLFNTTPIIEGDKATLSFYFEGGFDPYTYSQRKIFAHDMTNSDKDEKTAYVLYALPGLRVDYKATENLNLYGIAGARMENIHTTGCEAQGFEWQPVAQVGFKVTF